MAQVSGANPTASSSLEKLAREFEAFAETCRHSGARLYEALSLEMAVDRELLGLAAKARYGPVPNLFFAAAHFLLLRG
jgi:uncharacterized protein DUF2332